MMVFFVSPGASGLFFVQGIFVPDTFQDYRHDRQGREADPCLQSYANALYILFLGKECVYEAYLRFVPLRGHLCVCQRTLGGYNGTI